MICFSYFVIMKELSTDPQMNTAVDTINNIMWQFIKQVKELPADNISLYDFFKGDENVLKLIRQSVNLSPDVMEILTNALINDPSYLMSIVFHGDPWGYLCNNHTSDDLRKVFILPEDVNVEEVHQALCEMSTTVLVDELTNKLGLGDKAPLNWTLDLNDIEELNTKIMAVVNDISSIKLPDLDIKRMEKILQDLADAGQYDPEYVWRTILDMVLLSLDGADIGGVTSTFISVYKVVIDFVNDMMGRLDFGDNSLDISSLFSDKGKIMEILEIGFGIDSNVVEQIMTLTVEPQKVFIFLFFHL